MTKRVQPNRAKIELMANVVEVVSEQERKYTDGQIKDFEKGKQNRDIKMLTALLRQKLLIPLL